MNNTLSNGFKLLEYLAQAADPHSVKDLAEAFGLPNSHICRLLKTLTETGYVEQTGQRRYIVSAKILSLSHSKLERLAIRGKCHPALVELTAKLQCDAYLAIPYQGRAIIADVTYKGGIFDGGMTVGAINSVNTSACGKVCAAYVPAKEQDAFLAANELRVTPKSIHDPALLKEHLAKVRRDGVAVCDDEAEMGTYAAACPVPDKDGNLLAAVGVAAFFPDDKQKALIIQQLKHITSLLSTQGD